MIRVLKRNKNQVGDQAEYVCDWCLMEIKGGSILVYLPEGHPSATDPSFSFCGDQCLIKFIEDSVNRFGTYKSKVFKRLRPSKESIEPKGTMEAE